MNVYDFDNTILRGDSTALFALRCLRRHARLWRRVPGFLGGAARYLTGRKDKRAFKEGLFRALMGSLDDPAAEVEAFWDAAIRRVKPFYAGVHRENDVVITASPEFLVRPACRRLGIKHCLGSPVDARTGCYAGENCHGEEKVRRFREAFPGAAIDDFYSDSHSDDPLARLAARAHLVRGQRILPWR